MRKLFERFGFSVKQGADRETLEVELVLGGERSQGVRESGSQGVKESALGGSRTCESRRPSLSVAT